jgi:hypothetical protein
LTLSLSLRLLLVGVLLASGSAMAAQFVFTTGNFSGPDNTLSAEADITVNANSLTITLKNLTPDIGFTTDELTGFQFVTTGSTPTFKAAPFSVSDPGGAIDCSTGTCVSDNTGSAPFGWGVTGSGTVVLEPQGLHPYAIVNSAKMDFNHCGGGVNGNICNDQHNPFLNGPVTFTIGFTGAAPTGFKNVKFLFGTQPTYAPGSLTATPEPRLYGLVLFGGLGAALLVRRRAARLV